jgi:hypothetical protein
MAMPVTYIVRVYRSEKQGRMAGTVEVVRSGAVFPFRNGRQLWALLARPRVLRR